MDTSHSLRATIKDTAGLIPGSVTAIRGQSYPWILPFPLSVNQAGATQQAPTTASKRYQRIAQPRLGGKSAALSAFDVADRRLHESVVADLAVLALASTALRRLITSE